LKEEREDQGISLVAAIGSFIIGHVVCRSCREKVIGIIDSNSLVTLLHIGAEGKNCPGSYQTADQLVADSGDGDSVAQVVFQPANLLAAVA